MQHEFSSVPSIDIKRSKFRRPHTLKTAFDVDYLVPIYCDEAMPGDTFVFRGRCFGRLSTPVVPIMDDLYLDTFWFSVPIRLIDKNFAKVLGERLFGDTLDTTLVPQISTTSDVSIDDGVANVEVGTLSDYLGIPVGVGNLSFCPYWHRAYNLVWNEWFRDENLQEALPVGGLYADGTQELEDISQYNLVKRAYGHDVFRSALPWPQKGPAVFVGPPFGSAPVIHDDESVYPRVKWLADSSFSDSVIPDANVLMSADAAVTPGVVSKFFFEDSLGGPATGNLRLVETTGLKAVPEYDLGITVNMLRESLAVQSLLERDARTGTRIWEIIKGHFGVDSPELRFQRPEYLGGFSSPMAVTSVAQTSATDENGTTPQGNLSAFITVSDDVHWIKSFTEHCVILGLANVRSNPTYQQGLPRMFSRRTRYDFYWPEFANLGEVAILNKELYAQGTEDDDKPFGYQERWYEYRYHPNMITGVLRSTAANSLDVWHLAQKFESLPQLNSEFIEQGTPIDRVLAVADEPDVILDCSYDVECTRPMPLYSVPSLGRHL